MMEFVGTIYCNQQVHAGESISLVVDGHRLSMHLVKYDGWWICTSIFRDGNQWSYKFVIDNDVEDYKGVPHPTESSCCNKPLEC